MAARKTPSKGGKPDKLMRDTLMLELHQDSAVEASNGRIQKIKRFRLVARALIRKAIDGDVQAAKEINDRIDGRLTNTQFGGPSNDGGLSLEELIHMSYQAGKQAS